MDPGTVILLAARSVAERDPDRWWVPPRDALEAIEPGLAYVKVLAVACDADGEADVWRACAVWFEVEARDGEHVSGPIVDSELDADGYGEGDGLTVALDRVFDLAVVDAEGELVFNHARARFAVGKRVLVGITVLAPDGDEVVDRHSFAGTIAGFEADRGIELRLDDRSAYWLPPDTRPLREAPPGEYQLRATGQTIVNPDYLTTWTVTATPDTPGPSPDGFAPPRDADER